MAVFYNQATLSYQGGTVNSNVAAGELLDAFSAEKTAVSADYSPGSSVIYVLSLVNSGVSPLTGIAVSDDLGGYLFDGNSVWPLSYVAGSLTYFVGGAQQPADALTISAGPPLTVSGITIPAGGNAMLIYEAQATAFAPMGPGAQITNTATLTGAGTDITAQATVPARSDAMLTVNKAISPQTVTGNERLTYTFTILNSGAAAADAADAVTLTDTFDPVLSDLAVTLGSSVATLSADYTYDEATGAFATVPGVLTVPAATFAQTAEGQWVTTPGVTVVTVEGTV